MNKPTCCRSTLVRNARRSSRVTSKLWVACEQLEVRALLCGGAYDFHNFAKDFPAESEMLANPPAARRAPNSAVINWTNRGSSGDNFTNTFGTINGEKAREVVDVVLAHYQRVISSFNHFNDVNVINVTISMDSSGTGHGGGASNYTENAAGQPIGGSIVLDRGDDLGGSSSGDGGGYFVDPTPYDYSEFAGTITNAFAVNAGTGSAALGKYDLYTIVALELTHVLGINGSSNLYNSRAHYTNTNISDTAEGGGIGKLYAYDSPLIKHLMTSNNGGASGSDRGKPLHGAGPGAPIDFAGSAWEGAHDTMNAIYENGRRYLVPETARLIMEDGLLYSTVPAQQFGTAYTILDQTARTLTVRGAAGVSNDKITVEYVGGKVVVSVDVPADFAGTWTSPGGGDFPAWTSSFSPIEFDRVIVNAGDGADTIRVYGSHPLQTIVVNAEAGNDFVQVGNGFIDNTVFGAVTVSGGSGSDTLSYNDAFDTSGDDAYQVTLTYVQKSNVNRATYGSDVESVDVLGSTTNNTINVDSMFPNSRYAFYGLGGNDTFNIVPNSAFSIDVQGGIGTNTLRVNDLSSPGGLTYTVNTAGVLRNGTPEITHASVQNVVLDASNQANTINVSMQNGGPAVTVNGNGGDDTLLIDCTQYSGSAAQNPITMNGGAGADGSSIFVKLGGTTSVIGSAVTGNNATVNYGTLERLDLVGGLLAETFALYSTPAGLNMQIFAGDSNDIIMLGGAFAQPFTLDNVQAPLIVRGEGGFDTFALFDTAQTAARNYTVTSLSVTVSGGSMAEAGYDSSVEELLLFGGSGNDTMTVPFSLATTPITLNGGGGADTLNVTGHATNTPVTVDGGTGLDTINVNTDNSGTATALIHTAQDLAALNINTGGTAVISANGNRFISTQTLSIQGSGKLDLNDNDFLATTTPRATIQNYIRTAYNFGNWNGAGILSSTARTNPADNTTLGLLSGTEFNDNNGGLFNGRTVFNSDVLVKYTYFGDVDFNGRVDVSDYNLIDFGFSNHLTGWSFGDADYSGGVDVSDYNLIDFAFASQTAAL